jgi:hypothetical protein
MNRRAPRPSGARSLRRTGAGRPTEPTIEQQLYSRPSAALHQTAKRHQHRSVRGLAFTGEPKPAGPPPPGGLLSVGGMGPAGQHIDEDTIERRLQIGSEASWRTIAAREYG